MAGFDVNNTSGPCHPTDATSRRCPRILATWRILSNYACGTMMKRQDSRGLSIRPSAMLCSELHLTGTDTLRGSLEYRWSKLVERLR